MVNMNQTVSTSTYNHEEVIEANGLSIQSVTASGSCGNVISDDKSCSRSTSTTEVFASDPTGGIMLDLNPIIRKTSRISATRPMKFFMSKGTNVVSDIDAFIESCSCSSTIPDQESVGDSGTCSEDRLSDFYPDISDDDKDSDYEDSASRTSSIIQARCRRVRSRMYKTQTQSGILDEKVARSPRKKKGKHVEVQTSRAVGELLTSTVTPEGVPKSKQKNQAFNCRGINLAAISAAIMQEEIENKNRMEFLRQTLSDVSQESAMVSHPSQNEQRQAKLTFPPILFQMLQDAETQPFIHDIICWSHSGYFFVI